MEIECNTDDTFAAGMWEAPQRNCMHAGHEQHAISIFGCVWSATVASEAFCCCCGGLRVSLSKLTVLGLDQKLLCHIRKALRLMKVGEKVRSTLCERHLSNRRLDSITLRC